MRCVESLPAVFAAGAIGMGALVSAPALCVWAESETIAHGPYVGSAVPFAAPVTANVTTHNDNDAVASSPPAAGMIALAQGVTRPWIGPEFFANRLQDWQLTNGVIQCIEQRNNRPLRTLHLLTQWMDASPGEMHMSVRVNWDGTGDAAQRRWAGFLIGAGGEHVDHRLSALVHHKPAEDGGLLALIDERGNVQFRDMATGVGGGNLWSIGSPLADGDAPRMDTPSGDAPDQSNAWAYTIELQLSVTHRDDDTSVLTLTAIDTATGETISTATLRDAPLSKLDGAVALVSHRGQHTFSDWALSGSKVRRDAGRAFGPIISAMHTLSDGTLKMTAQLPPLAEKDTRRLMLQLWDGQRWYTAARGEYVERSCTATFRVDQWDASQDHRYRITYLNRIDDGSYTPFHYEGVIRAEPDQDTFVIAALTCHKTYTGGLKWNHQGVWFPSVEIVSGVSHHRPDFLFFSGDQIYEGDLTPAETNPEHAMLDYLYKWYRWCWSFRDLARDTPCVTIPDDHDVYHGNLWGAGGKKAQRTETMTAQDSGGYKMPPWFVNAVHRTQTSHLPDPYDPTPVEQGISVYYTQLDYGGISFAIISDRQFKSSPTVAVPAGDFRNGWPRAEGFDPVTDADVDGAVLLGERQLAFLEHWAGDWDDGVWMKVLLSQSIFNNLATLPEDAASGSVIPSIPILEKGEYLKGQKLAADADSHGWPQTGRNKAVAILQKCFAIHLAGDQHLGAVIQYGLDGHRNGGYAFSTPSIANTWPRRWFPPRAGKNRANGAPPYTGDFRDGFGNPMTVWAVANPYKTNIEPTRLNDAAPGYGIVRLERHTRKITMECWPRWVDPSQPDAEQFDGWPVVFHQYDNGPAGNRQSRMGETWHLPIVELRGVVNPVLQLRCAQSGEMIYNVRMHGTMFSGTAPHEGTYMLRVGDPARNDWRTLTLHATAHQPFEGVWLDF